MKKKGSPLIDLSVKVDSQPAEAGKVLTGNVSFAIDANPIFVKDIRVTFEGKSKVSLSGVDSASVGVKDKQVFVGEVQCANQLLFNGEHRGGGAGGLTQFKFAVGSHTVPFEFPLSTQAPNSFVGKYGVIRYFATAKVTLVDGTKWESVGSFEVEGVEDLNWFPQAVLPVTWKQHYSKRNCGIKKFDIHAVLKVPRTGYLPGDDITISGEVVNRHKRKAVSGSTVQLIQRIIYRIGSKQKATRTVIARTFMDPILPTAVQMWEDVTVTIPETAPPSFLRGCEQIAVFYELTVTVEPGVRFGTPIVVGTRPYSAENLHRFMKALPWRKSTTGSSEEAFDDDVPIPPPVATAAPPPPPPPPPPPFYGRPPPPQMHPSYGLFGMFRPTPQPMMVPPPFAGGLMPPPSFYHRRRQCWTPPFMRKPVKPYYYGGHGQQYQSAGPRETKDCDERHVLKIEEIVD